MRARSACMANSPESGSGSCPGNAGRQEAEQGFQRADQGSDKQARDAPMHPVGHASVVALAELEV